jgi:epoxyqueuosine reductase
MTSPSLDSKALLDLSKKIKLWGKELGFSYVGITDIDLKEDETYLQQWLAQNFQGSMDYMSKHGSMRSHPEELLPGSIRVISARMDYMPQDHTMTQQLLNKENAYISRYALGRDYHKLIRKRMTLLGEKIEQESLSKGYRAFVDSAPLLERALARKAGHGWVGKNTMLINRKAGSYFFLSELLTDLPLPTDLPYEKEHCAACTACIDLCPTQAFVGDKVLDARRCISYLTIELKGSIPKELRSKIGNRIFGCDDCQICCPWNKIYSPGKENDFTPRHHLDKAQLLTLFNWDEDTFLQRTQGSAIRRTGYLSWQRNIAVALGNAPSSIEVVAALQKKLPISS